MFSPRQTSTKIARERVTFGDLYLRFGIHVHTLAGGVAADDKHHSVAYNVQCHNDCKLVVARE